jgi:transcriptional regulator with XRE-family HTH domain
MTQRLTRGWADSASGRPSTDRSASLTSVLREARRQSRISQLELSHRLDVSQRHISFVEVGRARPGRALLLRWLAELAVPLDVRNRALAAAGYAPVYDEEPLDGPHLAIARTALDHLLSSHEPMPAVVIDSDWTLLSVNRGFTWLVSELVEPGTEAAARQVGDNLLDLMLMPGGLAARVTNLAEVGPILAAQLRQESVANPALLARAEAIQEISGRLSQGAEPAAQPVAVTRFTTRFGELAFFSMFTTFGTPHNINLASLRVELMYAADPHTRALVTKGVSGAGAEVTR